MWFIFVLPVAMASSVAALFSVTGGMNFIIFAAGAMEWQRRRGHKAGEGRFSERENDVYYGTGMDEQSDHDLTRDLGRLSEKAPEAFAPYIGKKYDFTKSEGMLLRAMVKPAIKSLNDLEVITEMLQEDPKDDELQSALLDAVSTLGSLIHPIIVYLSQFPETRVKRLT